MKKSKQKFALILFTFLTVLAFFGCKTAVDVHTVTYDGNGNTGGRVPVDTTEYESGEVVTVLSNTGSLEKSGYEFSGWNTAADGSGTSRVANDIFAMGTSDVILYAQWAGLYTVTYDGNGNTGGSVPTGPADYESGEVVTVQGNTGILEKEGYAFAGWNTAANGGGTPYEAGDTFVMGTSDVILYARWSGLSFVESILYASDGEAGDNLGRSIDISGNYAIVGAEGEDTGGDEAGAAYIFKNDGSDNWEEVEILQASDIAAWDYFGISVSISGNYAIVGASGKNDLTGAAYIFRNDGSDNWVEVETLQASDIEYRDRFGYSVSISGDYAIVGADWEGTGGSKAGAAYIYKNDGSDNWGEADILHASDAEASDYFGCSVSISGDYAIVGAYKEDTDGGDAGAAYIFKNDGSNNWGEADILHAPDAEAGDYFGYSVGISGDCMIVGARGEDSEGDGAGAAYIFE